MDRAAPAGLVGTGLVRTGFLGSGPVGTGLVGTGLVGTGLVGTGLVAARLVATRFVSTGRCPWTADQSRQAGCVVVEPCLVVLGICRGVVLPRIRSDSEPPGTPRQCRRAEVLRPG
jgi:hypothetical protein